MFCEFFYDTKDVLAFKASDPTTLVCRPDLSMRHQYGFRVILVFSLNFSAAGIAQSVWRLDYQVGEQRSWFIAEESQEIFSLPEYLVLLPV
jgi:hypothetical protein